MKTITIKQPWASLIVEGIKDIENRTWPTNYRGRVLIHSGTSVDKNAIDKISKFNSELARKLWFDINDKKLLLGTIIGSVEIVNCVINNQSIWAENSQMFLKSNIAYKPIYNLVLANPILFPEPIHVKGKLSFWDYPNILAEPEEKGGELFCHCQIPVKLESQVMSMVYHFRCRYCGGKWYK